MSGFVCLNSTTECIPRGAVCNGFSDCSNGSDEDPAMCAAYNCSSVGYERVSGEEGWGGWGGGGGALPDGWGKKEWT